MPFKRGDPQKRRPCRFRQDGCRGVDDVRRMCAACYMFLRRHLAKGKRAEHVIELRARFLRHNEWGAGRLAFQIIRELTPRCRARP